MVPLSRMLEADILAFDRNEKIPEGSIRNLRDFFGYELRAQAAAQPQPPKAPSVWLIAAAATERMCWPGRRPALAHRDLPLWRARGTGMEKTIRVIKHETVTRCGSYEVRFSDGRPSV